MVECAKRNQVKLMVVHIERFNPAVTRLKQLISESALGQLIQISTTRVGPFSPRTKDVGIVVDLATHDIDIARYLVDMEPISIFSKCGHLRNEKEDYAVVVLDFDKIIACIEVNWFSPNKIRTLVVTGSKGTAYLDYIEQELIVHYSDSKEKVEVPKEEPLRLELEHFLDCVETNSSPLVDGYQGMKVLEIALKATK